MNRLLTISLFLRRLSGGLVLRSEQVLDRVAINQGRLLSQQLSSSGSADLSDYGFSVFSQWDEDGIIQKLVSLLPGIPQTFIELGVEDYRESNTRFLLMKDNWSGFVVDGDRRNVEAIRSSYYFWKYELEAKAHFLTRENINSVVQESGFSPEVGILSIDLDGVDYHILEAITGLMPWILVCEYNALMGSEEAVTVPYRPDFNRTSAHYSNLYWGASIASFQHLAKKLGMVLVGVNSAGNNAFFVREAYRPNSLRRLTVKEAFKEASFREARDKFGRLTLMRSAEQGFPFGMPLEPVK